VTRSFCGWPTPDAQRVAMLLAEPASPARREREQPRSRNRGARRAEAQGI
jgi:hypothetical protein